MSTGSNFVPPAQTATAPSAPTPIIIQQPRSLTSRLVSWAIFVSFLMSLVVNLALAVALQDYFGGSDSATERFHSGDKTAETKLALIRVKGTIMPPYTERILKDIKQAKEDDKVKGVLLVVDSPGGFVADSHQIYHKLTELRTAKPIVVLMQALAASGGYYVAMGAGESGKIFAEPITWTGSIGVIIPHYEVTELAAKVGVKSAPLTTGKFKDTLTPFREMTEEERELWNNIMNQSFEQFLSVIDENRATLNADQIRKLATGQIYTAKDAKQFGLVDEIGYEEDALKELKTVAGVETVRVISYHHATGLLDILSGSAEARDPRSQWRALLEAAVPRAMYYCAWDSGFPLSF